jgi:hypothetical protein
MSYVFYVGVPIGMEYFDEKWRVVIIIIIIMVHEPPDERNKSSLASDQHEVPGTRKKKIDCININITTSTSMQSG